MKTTLVTGGCGFIGSALVAEFQRAGDDVHVLDNNSYGSRHTVDVPEDHFHAVNILDRAAVQRTMDAVRPTTVIHLAAIHFIPHCNQFPFDSANVNLTGTVNVLDAARSTGGVGKLFFASTAAVYPIVDAAIPETHPVGPLDIYGLSKTIGERLCHEYHLATGVPTVVCRFFNAFGPNETNPHLIPEIQSQILAGKRTLELGNLDPKRDFIHTHDMSRAIVALLGKFASGYDVFNLGRGEEYSVREIVAAFSRQLGEPVEIKVDPARVRKVERMHLLADVSKLRSFTGWEPRVGLDEGIKTLLGERR